MEHHSIKMKQSIEHITNETIFRENNKISLTSEIYSFECAFIRELTENVRIADFPEVIDEINQFIEISDTLNEIFE